MPTSNFLSKQAFNSSHWKQVFIIIAVIVFAIISITSTPFLYEYKNSGRYILPVLRTMDPELFQNDPVVDSYALFESIFYQLLARILITSSVAPQSLETALFILYAGIKILLFFGLFSLTYPLSNDILPFTLLAIWGLHRKSAFLGGISYQLPHITHETVAFVMGLLALSLLLRQRLLGFWILSSLALFVHSLVAFHLVLLVAPVVLFRTFLQREFKSSHFLGIGLFVISLAVYVLVMAPPPMTPTEANIFLSQKGAVGHISPFNQGFLSWVNFLILALLGILTHALLSRNNKEQRRLVEFILFGFIATITLSSIATLTQILRLVQIQPMRMFYWITFLCYVLLVLVTAQALKEHPTIGLILLSGLLLTFVDSLWAIPVQLFGTFYVIGLLLIRRQFPQYLSHAHVLGKIGMGIICLIIIVCWLINVALNLGIDSFSIFAALPALGILTTLMIRTKLDLPIYPFDLGLILVVTVILGSIYHYNYFDNRRTDPDWIAIQEWSERNTEKSDRFITPPSEGDFRVRSLRTSVNDGSSAMAWVAPSAYLDLVSKQEMVSEALQNNQENLNDLFALARQWNVKYVVVKDRPNAANYSAVFQSGSFAIYEVP